MLPPDSDEPEALPLPIVSLSLGSAARFAAEMVAIGLGFGTALITARSLGPDGKGVLSALSYLSVLAAAGAALGLGEAGVTAAAKGERTLAQVASATMGALVLTCLVAVPVFVGLAILQFPDLYVDLTAPLVITAASIPFIAVAGIYSAFLDAQQQFVSAAVARVVMATMTAFGTVLFVTIARFDLDGAVIGASAGWISGAAFAVVLARRSGLPLWPSWDLQYLRGAVRLGVPIQLSYLLMVLGSRVDLLLVNAIAGNVPAGRYSVALTIGAMVTYGPFVLAIVSYPRLAGLPEDELAPFVARLSRLGVLSAAVPTLALVALLPVLLPLTFGDGYRGSTAPALLLAASGIFWSLQWVLCRARAARGAGRLLLRSFGTSLVVMVVGDLALIGPLGLVGAGLASLVGAGAGAAVAVRSYAREDQLDWRSLVVPHRRDAADLAALVFGVIRSSMATLRTLRRRAT